MRTLVYFLIAADVLLKLGDSEGAKEALTVAENVFVNTFAMQLVSKPG